MLRELLLLLLMASSSYAASTFVACRGLRLDGTGWAELCDLDKGGVYDAEYVFGLEARPGLNSSMTYQQTIAYVERKKGEDAARQFVVKMRARAAELQQQKGGLYRGHRDCVRSTFCNIDEGIAEHGRMCLACMLLLNHTQLFRRASNRDANSSAPFHPTANHRYSTSSQKSRKLDGQYTWRGIDARREKRKDISN